ncbi:hypothetical protein FJ364_02370 [Candidatus Dependentiae bacterium]|nr:hypothetical protein [Candidatus Dependentiae bacterium]
MLNLRHLFLGLIVGVAVVGQASAAAPAYEELSAEDKSTVWAMTFGAAEYSFGLRDDDYGNRTSIINELAMHGIDAERLAHATRLYDNYVEERFRVLKGYYHNFVGEVSANDYTKGQALTAADDAPLPCPSEFKEGYVDLAMKLAQKGFTVGEVLYTEFHRD